MCWYVVVVVRCLRQGSSSSRNHKLFSEIAYFIKVKQSRYRPGVAQRVPGS